MFLIDFEVLLKICCRLIVVRLMSFSHTLCFHAGLLQKQNRIIIYFRHS